MTGPLFIAILITGLNIPLITAEGTLLLQMDVSKTVIILGEEIDITLILTNIGDTNATIEFGQPLFDAFYCTGEGCYRWSDGKAFIQVFLQISLEPGESHTETLRWNLYKYISGEYYPPEPGTYTLNGVCIWAGLWTSITVIIASPGLHLVPDDYLTIQEAINNATEGDTIFVREGTYYENVVVNKSISLIGENKDSTVIDGNLTGTVVVITANSTSISGFTIQNSGEFPHSGIYLNSTADCEIIGNVIINHYDGIGLSRTVNSTIVENSVIDCERDGIMLAWSQENEIASNDVTRSSNNAIELCVDSHLNAVTENKITGNAIGIGIYDSDENNIHNNMIIGNNLGIWLQHSHLNLMNENLIRQNGFGIQLFLSDANHIYHNSFVDNPTQALTNQSYMNLWDNFYPSGGNYWTDYDGADLHSGPNQDENDSDGIGDTPHTINENNQDNYPLMKPYRFGDLNGDKKVDIKDVATAALAFGSYPGHPKWNLIADANYDNKIDIKDIALVASNFGKTYL